MLCLWNKADAIEARWNIRRAAAVQIVGRRISAPGDDNWATDVRKVGYITTPHAPGRRLHGVGKSACRRPRDHQVVALTRRGDDPKCRGWIGRVDARQELVEVAHPLAQRVRI